jgi:hypothetical protein
MRPSHFQGVAQYDFAQQTGVRVGQIQSHQPFVKGLECRSRQYHQVAIQARDNKNSIGGLVPKFCRDCQPAFIIETMVVLV